MHQVQSSLQYENRKKKRKKVEKYKASKCNTVENASTKKAENEIKIKIRNAKNMRLPKTESNFK